MTNSFSHVSKRDNHLEFKNIFSHIFLKNHIGTSPFVVNRPSDSKLWWRSLTLIATDEMGGLVVTKETVYFSGGKKKEMVVV